MVRIALAALIFVLAASAPAAAMRTVGDSHRGMSVAKPLCECCDEMRIDAALACAAFCHAVLPSAIGAMLEVFVSGDPMLVLTTDGEGLTLKPPAPPPRS